MSLINPGYPALSALAFAALLSIAACESPTPPDTIQGYIEGEYLYIASSLAGTVETLHTRRGAQVAAGDLLFSLDSTPEEAALRETEKRLTQARAALEDLYKGRRPTEIQSIQAQVSQADAALTLAESELARMLTGLPAGAATTQEIDRVRTTRDQAAQQAARLRADLETAQLGARADQIAAAQANVQAHEASLARAEWDLGQKRLSAPEAALVFDTLYRPGEWVAAGRPVVSLLPPANIKLRAFIPEPRIGSVHIGDTVQVTVDGAPTPVKGRVTFISPQAEYTPPVIYSRQSREKFVFMIEAVFEPGDAATLHPGQPVDVKLGP
jgi:HlyD family secretion protein